MRERAEKRNTFAVLGRKKAAFVLVSVVRREELVVTNAASSQGLSFFFFDRAVPIGLDFVVLAVLGPMVAMILVL